MAVISVHTDRLHDRRTSRFVVVRPDAPTALAKLSEHEIKAQFADDGGVDAYVAEGQSVAALVDLIKGIFARMAIDPRSHVASSGFSSLLSPQRASTTDQENK